ncbi:transposase for IS3503d [Corynebacterium jeikeium K411]|uniref:Transposase for IS3503d n=1 Tax=Corynebacterium jeikeium (strain K411) TaxID=306537 RepID=Q4JY59_CORJK|nr:transposase for IS3503d [Corynebacterium jeikeium K411]
MPRNKTRGTSDTAIDTSYQHNLGIQKGWIK